MNKIYYLSTCSTCSRIMRELGVNASSFTLRDIKTIPVSAAELEELKKLAGSYEALFSRVALKYRALGLDKLSLTEPDYKKQILSEYTFLKRPVLLIGKQIVIGNSKKTVAAAQAALLNES